MINGIKNIDKFLRDLFQNYSVQPRRDSWDKIADALDNTNPKDALIPDIDKVGTLFKGYKVTPSEGVWQNIFKILERDKFTARRMSKSAISALVTFFSNTTVKVVTSLAVVSGIALLVFNPFKDDQTKLASYESPKQIKTYDLNVKTTAIKNRQSINLNPKTTSESKENNTKLIRTEPKLSSATPNPKSIINNTESEINNPYPAKPMVKEQSTSNITTENSQIKEQELNSSQNTQIINPPLNKTSNSVQKTQDAQQIINNYISNTRKSIISDDITVTYSNETTSLIADPKSKTLIKSNRMVKYPSIKMGIKQSHYKTEKANMLLVDLQKKMDVLVDRFYRQWAKKFKGARDQFYFEASYLPIYGSTTFIAQQHNSPTLSRSYNEYSIGSPSNCLGLNFGYNYKKFVYETGIGYEARHTRRNDDLTWISYDTNLTFSKDSIGFIFNNIDSTYHTIYKTDTSYNQKELKKNYRTRMTYHTIEIPILIGYKLLEDKRSTLIVRGGILTSIITKSASENAYTDETAKPYIVYPKRENIGFSALMNLSYDYNIKNNLKISATFACRYNLTGLYKGYSINRGAATYGLGVGIKYLF